jgi:uncharacterized RDD family membrane protein YckC
MFDHMDTIQVNTSQHVTIDYPVAGLGERIAARLIDLAIFVILYILIMIVFGITGFTIGLSKGPYTVILTVIAITVIAGFVFYDLLLEIFMNGQSIGKKLMKIKVISMDGGQASIGQYFIRWLFRLIDFTLSMQMGGLICVAVTDRKQRIGDIVAGTILIRTVPKTGHEHIAFLQPAEQNYTPVFAGVHQLNDRNIELIHEVLTTFYQTHNFQLIEATAAKIASILSVNVPQGMNGLNFLQTIVKDYNYLTANESHAARQVNNGW